jgi:hypothetical protein
LVAAADAATDSDVVVFDGQPTSAEEPKYLCIGYDPDTPMTVDFTQVPAAMRGSSGHARREEYDILCYLVVSGGDSDFPGLTAAAFDVLADIENYLRTAPGITLGGTLGSGGTAQLTSGQVDRGENTHGDAVALRFRVTCKARI